MDLLETMQNRRSVRSYTGEKIAKEKLDKILQAGLLSASGRSRKPWEFVVVQEKETLEKLSHCRVGAAKMLENAGCAILVFANPEKTDVWVEDCSIAMSNMHLTAADQGVGSCWIQIRNRNSRKDGMTSEAFLKELFSLEEKYAVEAILSLGIPAQERPPLQLDERLWEKVHFETF